MKTLKNLMMQSLPGVTITFMIAAFVFVYFMPNMVTTIPAGYIGVLWKRFDNGTVINNFFEKETSCFYPGIRSFYMMLVCRGSAKTTTLSPQTGWRLV